MRELFEQLEAYSRSAEYPPQTQTKLIAGSHSLATDLTAAIRRRRHGRPQCPQSRAEPGDRSPLYARLPMRSRPELFSDSVRSRTFFTRTPPRPAATKQEVSG